MSDGSTGGAPNGPSGPPRRNGKPAQKSEHAPRVFIDEQYRFHLDHPLRFRGATAQLTRDADPVLDVIARIVRENPEIRRVQIRAYWDRGLAPDAAATLTQQQAEAVRDALVRRGVATERLLPTGMGASELAPPGGKAPAAARRVDLTAETAR